MDYFYKYQKYKIKYLLLRDHKFKAVGGNTTVDRNTSFDEEVYKMILLRNKSVVYSNLSLKEALLLAYIGTSSFGELAKSSDRNLGTSASNLIKDYQIIFGKEDTDVLVGKYKSLNDELTRTNVVEIANSIWINSNKNITVTSQYSDKAHIIGDIKNQPFNDIENSINSWVSQKTNGMITNMGKIDPESVLIIVNAIYFKAKWIHPFDIKNTIPQPFFLNENEQLECKFMKINSDKCHYYETDNVQILGKKYENDFMMIIILPKNQYKPIVVSDNKLIQYYNDLKEETVSIQIPKFTTESKHDLIPILQHIGINNIFIESHDKISTDKKSLIISKIIQKCKIIVDEEGTEAAAVTVVIMKESLVMPQKPKSFVANRPFSYYIIHEKTKTVIFNGSFYGK